MNYANAHLKTRINVMISNKASSQRNDINLQRQGSNNSATD